MKCPACGKLHTCLDEYCSLMCSFDGPNKFYKESSMSYNSGYRRGFKDFKDAIKQSIPVSLLKNPYPKGSIEFHGWYDANAEQTRRAQ